jgi:hypothetical protein
VTCGTVQSVRSRRNALLYETPRLLTPSLGKYISLFQIWSTLIVEPLYSGASLPGRMEGI